jgi:hypothetical protein
MFGFILQCQDMPSSMLSEHHIWNLCSAGNFDHICLNTRFDGNNWVRLFLANIWLGCVFFGSLFNLWGQTWPKHGEPVCLHWFC